MESDQTIGERASLAKQPMNTEVMEDWQLSQHLDWIERTPGEVIVISSEYCDGHRIRMHSHGRAQLLCPSQGSVTITTLQGRWMVPPGHAMWIPSGVEHGVEMVGLTVRLRSAYVTVKAHAKPSGDLRVLAMSELLRNLMEEATRSQPGTQERMAAIMQLILLEIPQLEERPFALPFPADPRLAKLCRDFVAAPFAGATIDYWANKAGMSRRSFTRAFQRETGLSLSMWRRQATLLAALPLLAGGRSVTDVALDLGYESAPAFTTMFRRMLGVAPRTYLQRAGRGFIPEQG